MIEVDQSQWGSSLSQSQNHSWMRDSFRQKLCSRHQPCKKDRTDLVCEFWFVTRWILLSTCGLSKFQIPSKFAKSSWSSGCGLNLSHPTNYIFTRPKSISQTQDRIHNILSFFALLWYIKENPMFWTNSNFSEIVSFSTQVRKVVRHLKLEIKYWTNTQKLMTHK